MDPNQLYLDSQAVFTNNGGVLTKYAWAYLNGLQVSLTTVDLTSQVTGVLPPSNGGTGVNNGSKLLTLGGNLTTSGAFATTFTMSAATAVTLPTSGLLVATTSPLTAVNLTVSAGVTANSGGIKHGRVTTGAIGSGADALVTLTWGTPFASASYTVSASVLDATTAAASLRVVHVETVTAAAVAVRVENTSAGSLTGTLLVIALHD